MLPIIVLLLCGSISLSHSTSIDRTGSGCKNPKGKNGDIYVNGCDEFKCVVRKWKKVGDVCRDSDLTISSTQISSPCRGCPSNRPYCSGICFLGFRCYGICLPTDLPYPRGCALQAGTLSDNECKSDCQEEGSESCNNCIGGIIPSHCKTLPTFGCFSCVASIIRAYQKCSRSSNVLLCMKENVASSCISCICSLACHLFGPGSNICKLCSNPDENSNVLEFYGGGTPTPPSPQCPPGPWHMSLENDHTKRKCFRIFNQSPASWTQARTYNCPSIGTNAYKVRLAIVDTPEKVSAVSTTVSTTEVSDCWIAGQQPPNPINPKSFDWVDTDGTRTLITGTQATNGWETGFPKSPETDDCIVTDSNGRWKNTACENTVKKCFVCEADLS